MSDENIIRAWKDAEFRNSLSEKERTSLPENPAGLVELTDTQLGVIAGGVARTGTEGPMCTLSSC
jgi:mersacidin/lichenicidin family type 2 lantibiotic